MSKDTKKKLAAVMFSRLEEYEKYSNQDKAFALDVLKEHNKIISSEIKKFNGRIIKFMDDTLFAEFLSATDSVRCALSIHNSFKKANGQNPDTFQMNVRIGIHMGEVYEKNNDLFGEGVNLAARIQPISKPSGTVTTQAIYNSIRSEKDILTRDVGRILLKNIKEPERVFKIYNDDVEYNKETSEELTEKLINKGINFADKSSNKNKIITIACAYLQNVGSPDDEFFCYGLTEDMILDLGKVNNVQIPLISKIIQFKDQNLEPHEIGEKLNVNFVVTGNIMKMGDNFRLSLQLHDCKKNINIWNESWEGNINKQGLRSKVIIKVLESIGAEIPESLASSLKKDEEVSPEAYELFVKARYLSYTAKNKIDRDVVLDLFKKAIKIDNNFVEARYNYAIQLFYSNDSERAVEVLDDALLIAKKNRDFSGIAGINNGYGIIYKNWGRYEQAIAKFEEALKQRAKEGNLKEEAKVLNGLGQSYVQLGQYDKSFEYLNRALDINRKLEDKREIAACLTNLSINYRRVGDYAKAIDYCKEAIILFEELENFGFKARTQMNLGQYQVIIGHVDEAEINFNETLEISLKINDLKSAGTILRGLGLVEINRKNWTKAQDYFKKALSYHQKSEHRPAYESTTLFLGVAYFYSQDYELAEKFIEKAVQITDRRKNVSFYGNTAKAVRVMILSKQGKAKENDVDEIFDMIELSKSTVQVAREYWYLSQSYLFLDIKEKYKDCLKKSQITLEAISQQISHKEYRDDYLNKPLIHQLISGKIKDLSKEKIKMEIEKNDKSLLNKTDSVFAFCPNCGFKNSNSFKFCPQCGTSLKS